MQQQSVILHPRCCTTGGTTCVGALRNLPPRSAAAHRRWFSGNSTGRLQASSCGTTASGDPVLSVLSSPRKQGGPYTCVSGSDE